MDNNNIDTTITTIPPKDIAMIEKLFLKMSDGDKLLLLENVMNGTITSKDVAIYEMTVSGKQTASRKCPPRSVVFS